MAGTRTEKFGTIYTRVKGLIKSGALKKADQPIWLSVYEAFPPKQPPTYETKVPDQKVRQLLYPEDFIRTKFYQTFGNPDVIDFKRAEPSLCQKFVDKYFELQDEGVETSQIFDLTTQALKEEGIRLRTANEKLMEAETGMRPRAMHQQRKPFERQKFDAGGLFPGRIESEEQAENQQKMSEPQRISLAELFKKHEEQKKSSEEKISGEDDRKKSVPSESDEYPTKPSG